MTKEVKETLVLLLIVIAGVTFAEMLLIPTLKKLCTNLRGLKTNKDSGETATAAETA